MSSQSSLRLIIFESKIHVIKLKSQYPESALYIRVQTPLLRPPQHWVVLATLTGLTLTSPSSPGASSEAGAESDSEGKVYMTRIS